MLVSKISLNNTQSQTTFGHRQRKNQYPINQLEKDWKKLRQLNPVPRNKRLAQETTALISRSGRLSQRRVSERLGDLYALAARAGR